MKARTLLISVVGGVVVAVGVYLANQHFASPSLTVPKQSSEPLPSAGRGNGAQSERAVVNQDQILAPAFDSNKALEKFISLKDRAAKGDAASQRELAELYGLCIPVNTNAERYLASYEAIAKQAKTPANAEGLRRAAKAAVNECSVVDNGAIIPIEARELWLAQAAKNGDLAAQAQIYLTSNQRLQGEQLKGFMDHVVNSRDPNAVFEMGQLVAGNVDSGDVGAYTNVANDKLSGYAWSIAACRMGLACGTGSEIMNSACLNTSGCSSTDFESFVRDNLVSAGDAALLNSKVQEVSAFLPTKK